MSCDLKLESAHRASNYKSQHRKTNNLTLLIKSINRIYLREELHFFRQIKIQFKEGVANEEKFVSSFAEKIHKLDQVASLKKKNKLCKAMAMWRRHTVDLAKQ